MQPDKNGQLICNVCGQDWASQHTIGGNCIQPPMKRVAAAATR